MTDIISTMIEVTLTSLIITGAVFLFRQVFRKQLSQRLKYILWLLLVARLCLPVTLDMGFHLDELMPKQTVEERAASAVPADEAVFPWQRTVEAPQTEAVTPIETVSTTQTVTPVAAAPAAEAAVQPISWQAIVLAVWAAGTIGFGVWTLAVKLRFSRKLLASETAPRGTTVDLLDSCREELNIRRGVDILVTRRRMSPALMLISGRAVIVVPRCIEGSAVTLRYALLHELMHLKRCDHLMLALMGVLRCVWWFNPAVWLAFPAMTADMETACDAAVIAAVGDEKREYLITLLTMFTGENKSFAPDVARYKTRQDAARRLKGAFMKTKTNKLVVVTAILVAAVVGVCCFTTACSPSPFITTVEAAANEVQSAVDTPETAAADEAQPQPETAAAQPTVWTDELTDGNGNKITANAQIIDTSAGAPEIIKYQPKQFTQAQIDAMVNYFTGGAQLYAEDDLRTKSDVEYDLEQARKQLVEVEAANQNPDDISGTKQWIASLEEELKTVSDTAEHKPVTSALVADPEGMVLDAYAGKGGSDDVVIWAFQSNMDKFASISVRQRDASTGRAILPLRGTADETAQSVIEDLAQSLGIEGLTLQKTTPCAASNDPDNHVQNTRYYYTCAINGLPWMGTGDLILNDDPADGSGTKLLDWVNYSSSVSVDVGSGGVTAFTAFKCIDVTGRESVNMISADEAIEVFRKHAFDDVFKWQTDDKTAGQSYELTEVRLVMVSVTNADGACELRPAWNFVGKTDLSEDELARFDMTDETYDGVILMTVDAVTGKYLYYVTGEIGW